MPGVISPDPAVSLSLVRRDECLKTPARSQLLAMTERNQSARSSAKAWNENRVCGLQSHVDQELYAISCAAHGHCVAVGDAGSLTSSSGSSPTRSAAFLLEAELPCVPIIRGYPHMFA